MNLSVVLLRCDVALFTKNATGKGHLKLYENKTGVLEISSLSIHVYNQDSVLKIINRHKIYGQKIFRLPLILF